MTDEVPSDRDPQFGNQCGGCVCGMFSDSATVDDLKHANGASSPWTPEMQERVSKLLAVGLSGRETGAAVGMTKNQIIGWLDRRRRRYNESTTKDRLDALHAKMDAVLMETGKVAKFLKREPADGP